MKPKFKIWKEIELGVGPRDGNAFITAIEKAGIYITTWEKMMFVPNPPGEHSFTVFPKHVRVPLVKASVGKLGFNTEWARLDDIYTRAWDFNLGQCPDEVGPQLCLQCPEPLGELVIAMKAIPNLGGPNVFRVGDDKRGRWLGSISDNPSAGFNRDCQFVFVPREFLEALSL